MYEFLFEPCILRCLNFVWKKISLQFYDFTIQVYFAFSVPCQKYVFDNLDLDQRSMQKNPELDDHMHALPESTQACSNKLHLKSILES